MNEIRFRSLWEQTGTRLASTQPDPRRLALLHTGAALAASLVMTLIGFLLSRQMEVTGGLSGIGTRTLLESAQTVLQLALMLAMPFWEAGFLFCALSLCRGRATGPADFLRGFRRAGLLLRLYLLQTLLYFLVTMVAMQVASLVYMLTPWAAPMVELLEQMAADPTFLQTGMLPAATLETMAPMLLPIYIIFGIVLLVLAAPVFYRLRLAPYVVLDGGCRGALAAMGRSNRAMRGNCIAFFKLDLHLWWYYLLQLACAAVAYGNVILPFIGIQLPMGADGAFFLCYGIYIVSTLVLDWRFRARVETVYACAYDRLCPPETPELPAQG